MSYSDGVIARLKQLYWGTLAALSQSIAQAVWTKAPGAISRGADSLVLRRWEELADRSANPLLRAGAKYFSQSDEDGILLEILSRLGLTHGAFLEVGVGNGLENNTVILLMHGWRGVWVGNEDLAFSSAGATRLRFHKQFLEPKDVPVLVSGVFAESGDGLPLDLELISVDIDSCDRPIVEALLAAGCRPTVFVVEYNAKFPPPVRFWIETSGHWDHTDYAGCSLQAWWDLLVPAGYRLVVSVTSPARTPSSSATSSVIDFATCRPISSDSLCQQSTTGS